MLTCSILINIKSYTDTLLNMYLYGTKGRYIVENLFCQIFTNFVYFILLFDISLLISPYFLSIIKSLYFYFVFNFACLFLHSVKMIFMWQSVLINIESLRFHPLFAFFIHCLINFIYNDINRNISVEIRKLVLPVSILPPQVMQVSPLGHCLKVIVFSR